MAEKPFTTETQGHREGNPLPLCLSDSVVGFVFSAFPAYSAVNVFFLVLVRYRPQNQIPDRQEDTEPRPRDIVMRQVKRARLIEEGRQPFAGMHPPMDLFGDQEIGGEPDE